MEHLVRLGEWERQRVVRVLAVAGANERGSGPRIDGAAVLFFPASSLRTRVTFERGAALMGLQPIVFPPETLDKGEDLGDVARYLANWADVAVVRHPDIGVLDALAAADALPVVNAMTSVNHPCEVLADLYAVSRTRDPWSLRFVVVGPDGNIVRAWAEAASAFGLDVVQCCPAGLEAPGLPTTDDLADALREADVVITDGPGPHETEMAPYRIDAALLARAPASVQLVPCPPFRRGRELTADALESPAFTGHAFKSSLLPVQQAVLATVLGLA